MDDGAKRALREQGKSLLPPGISHCEGDFQAGEVVSIRDLDGTEFARGIAAYSTSDIKGKKVPKSEVIHRDNLVIL